MEPARPEGQGGMTSPAGLAMRELVEFVAHGLVDRPEAVQVTHRERGQVVELRLVVDPEEMGKVIGRQGRVAKALRSVLAIAATRAGKRVSLEIG
jgi:predicted RNA-binding protein YlqC (UPF0109 family)